MSAFSRYHQRGFLYQQIGAGADAHNQTEERAPRLEISTGSLSLEFREPYGQMGGNILRGRGHGGHQEDRAN